MKKWLTPALIAAIFAQLLVPSYLIANKYYILTAGTEYRFRVNPVDPYDAFRGRFVSLYPVVGVSGYGKYGVIAVGEGGFADVVSITDVKPQSGAYVKSGSRSWFLLPVDRYYMDEKLAPEAERIAWQRGQGREAYVTVRVKNGSLVVSGLYVDGVAIEDAVRTE